jgi:hypothetical protein
MLRCTIFGRIFFSSPSDEKRGKAVFDVSSLRRDFELGKPFATSFSLGKAMKVQPIVMVLNLSTARDT